MMPGTRGCHTGVRVLDEALPHRVDTPACQVGKGGAFVWARVGACRRNPASAEGMSDRNATSRGRSRARVAQQDSTGLKQPHQREDVMGA
ncbi:hypothetical protein MXAN_4902 [Myxococcus xanthus DK 1622]|uniref:Uncharacterized protein n=2 Tax=Myxococcus xanthus TaxID=34 RepID=Q1D2R4_MYXXD|nr:hypothetical protein MXAN_4902 [Myxococcus xanthus DK 1622]